MNKHDSLTPSDIILSTAKTIASDVKEMIDDCCEDLDQYSQLLMGMNYALQESKKNLEKHTLPLSIRKTKEHRALRKKIRAISAAIKVVKKLETTISLTMDDINQIMRPYDHDAGTTRFLDKIMQVEPTKGELKDIEDEGDENQAA